MKDMGVSIPFRRGGTLFAGGFLLHQLFTGSLFGTMETPSELIETYKGEKICRSKDWSLLGSWRHTLQRSGNKLFKTTHVPPDDESNRAKICLG